MEIVDAQIHIWEEDRPGRRWNPEFARTRGVYLEHGQAITADRAIAAMDAVGVDAAIVTAFFLYPDIDYAVEAAERYPDRFSVVPQIDLTQDHPEHQVERYLDQTGILAARMSFLTPNGPEHYQRLEAGDFEPIFDTAATHALPVMLVVSGQVEKAAIVLERHPELTVVIDHLGIVQGPHREISPAPFDRIGDLLRLAEFPNAAVKLCGVPTVSGDPYPYPDVLPHVRRVIDGFGPERVMWGSDFTRTRPMHTYAEALGYVRYAPDLSEAEKEWLLGKSARTLLNWPAPDVRPENPA